MFMKIVLLVFIVLALLLCIVFVGSLIYSHLSEVLYERKLRNNYTFVSKNFYERHMQEKAELKKRLNEYDELFDRIYRSKGNDFNFGIKIVEENSGLCKNAEFEKVIRLSREGHDLSILIESQIARLSETDAEVKKQYEEFKASSTYIPLEVRLKSPRFHLDEQRPSLSEDKPGEV